MSDVRYSAAVQLSTVCLALILLSVPGCGGPDQSSTDDRAAGNASGSQSGSSKVTDQLDDDLFVADDDRESSTGGVALSSGTSLDKEIPLKVRGIETVEDRYQDNSLKKRWEAKVFTNYNKKNPPEGSWVYHGSYEEFYPDGSKYCQGQHSDDKLSGQWTYWHVNGKTAKQGEYADGKLTGKWTYYRKDGTIKRVETYANNQRDGDWITYDKVGKTVLQKQQYKAGKPHGTWTAWHSEDQIAREAHYENNKLQGMRRDWYDNGQLAVQRPYKDGKLHGTFISWDRKGSELKKMEFENGKQKKKSS